MKPIVKLKSAIIVQRNKQAKNRYWELRIVVTIVWRNNEKNSCCVQPHNAHTL
jgi:hypothetical protein